MALFKRKRPRPITPWSREPRVHLDIQEGSATRAMFGEGGMSGSRILLSFRTTDGQIVDLDLDIDQAHVVIEQMTHAYHAIVPKLRTQRFGG